MMTFINEKLREEDKNRAVTFLFAEKLFAFVWEPNFPYGIGSLCLERLYPTLTGTDKVHSSLRLHSVHFDIPLEKVYYIVVESARDNRFAYQWLYSMCKLFPIILKNTMTKCPDNPDLMVIHKKNDVVQLLELAIEDNAFDLVTMLIRTRTLDRCILSKMLGIAPSLEMARLFFENGANPADCNPFYYACYSGSPKVLRYVIDLGCVHLYKLSTHARDVFYGKNITKEDKREKLRILKSIGWDVDDNESVDFLKNNIGIERYVERVELLEELGVGKKQSAISLKKRDCLF